MEEPKLGAETKRRVDLDTLLLEDLGQFGSYQARKLAICFVFVTFVAWSTMEYVFTTARISTRCLIPECDGNISGVAAEWSPEWLGSAAPAGDGCTRYAGLNASAYDPTCPAALFDQTTTTPCETYVYANQNSVVYDFDIACDEWSRSFLGSIRVVGSFLSMGITGLISDRWGRRLALVYCAFSTAWLGIARYWAGTYWGFVFSVFIESTVGAGGYSCAYILMMELVGPKYRVAIGASMNVFFATGQMSLAFFAWLVPDWRRLTLTLYIPQLITILLYWLMNESVRWLMSMGRYDESVKVLQEVARANGKYLSMDTLIALRVTNEEKKLTEMRKIDGAQEPWLPVVVFRHKSVLLRCLVCPVLWITSTLVYYGLSLNAVNLSGNSYANYAAVSAVEIPGFCSAVLLVGYLGRKKTLTGAYWVCAACMIGFLLLPEDYFGASLTIYLIGKLSIAVVVTSVWVYTTEIFPTQYRHRLLGYCNMLGRIGSIVAPLTPAMGERIWEPLPFALFAGFCVASGLLMFLLPETLGAKLPDTMEEADQLGTLTPSSTHTSRTTI